MSSWNASKIKTGKRLWEVRNHEIILERKYIDEITSVFIDIFQAMRGRTPSEVFLRRYDHDASDDEVALIKSPGVKRVVSDYVELHRSNSSIDYRDSKNFIAYDRTYFYLNLYKNLVSSVVMRDVLNIPANTMVDVGCGAGTFSLCASIFLRDTIKRFHLVDQAKFQIDIAKKMAEKFNIENCHFHVGDAISLNHLRGFRIASYWLCSNTKIYGYDHKSVLSTLFRDGLAVIDYKERIDEFVRYMKYYAGIMQTAQIYCSVPSPIQYVLRRETVSVHLLLANRTM